MGYADKWTGNERLWGVNQPRPDAELLPLRIAAAQLAIGLAHSGSAEPALINPSDYVNTTGFTVLDELTAEQRKFLLLAETVVDQIDQAQQAREANRG